MDLEYQQLNSETHGLLLTQEESQSTTLVTPLVYSYWSHRP
jgi:hypothetical protein